MNTTSPVPDPQQPLLFAPGELLACGLADAHSHPLVGTRTPDGVRSRRIPAGELAWEHQLIEWSRTGNSYAALGFDCDSRESVERAAACCMGAGTLPTPNVCSTRTASGHAQVFWLLGRPVHRGDQARAKPLQLFGRVAEYYRDAARRGPWLRGRPGVPTRSIRTTPQATPAMSRTALTSSPGRSRRAGGHRASRPRLRARTAPCSRRSASWRWAVRTMAY